MMKMKIYIMIKMIKIKLARVELVGLMDQYVTHPKAFFFLSKIELKIKKKKYYKILAIFI